MHNILLIKDNIIAIDIKKKLKLCLMKTHTILCLLSLSHKWHLWKRVYFPDIKFPDL